MKILFVIAAPIEGGGMTSYAPHFPHLGIAYLSAMLKKDNHAIKIVDMRLRYTLDELAGFIRDFNPDVVGVTTFSYHFLDSYRTIDFIKDNFPNVPVVLGGPHVSTFGKSVLEDTKVDAAIKGEGEYAILEYCQAIKDGCQDLSNIDGLFWRRGGEIVENKNREFLTAEQLNILPFPAYEDFELDRYISVKERKLLPIITSRGCPYSCVYCSVKLCMGRGFRARTAKNVVDELEHWYKKGFKVFDINDDNFTFDVDRAKEICNMIIARDLKIEYRMINGIRADRLDYELAKKMKESGCSFVSFGAETGNPEIMKNIKKNVTIEKIREAIGLANKVGWVHRVNFIVGHPGETYEKAMDTIRFAESLPSNFVTFYTSIPYPGTELFDWIKEHGSFIVPYETYLNSMEYVDAEPVFETKEFTLSERKKVLRMGSLISRKKYIQYTLGKTLGSFVFLFARFDKIWSVLMTVFQGTGAGYKIFRIILNWQDRKYEERSKKANQSA